MHPLRVSTVNETDISPDEMSEFQRIMKTNAVGKLFKLENGLPLSMDETEELTMLLVQADLTTPTSAPFRCVTFAKLTLIYTDMYIRFLWPSNSSVEDGWKTDRTSFL